MELWKGREVCKEKASPADACCSLPLFKQVGWQHESRKYFLDVPQCPQQKCNSGSLYQFLCQDSGLALGSETSEGKWHVNIHAQCVQCQSGGTNTASVMLAVIDTWRNHLCWVLQVDCLGYWLLGITDLILSCLMWQVALCGLSGNQTAKDISGGNYFCFKQLIYKCNFSTQPTYKLL